MDIGTCDSSFASNRPHPNMRRRKVDHRLYNAINAGAADRKTCKLPLELPTTLPADVYRENMRAATQTWTPRKCLPVKTRLHQGKINSYQVVDSRGNLVSLNTVQWFKGWRDQK